MTPDELKSYKNVPAELKEYILSNSEMPEMAKKQLLQILNSNSGTDKEQEKELESEKLKLINEITKMLKYWSPDKLKNLLKNEDGKDINFKEKKYRVGLVTLEDGDQKVFINIDYDIIPHEGEEINNIEIACEPIDLCINKQLELLKKFKLIIQRMKVIYS